MSRCTFAFALLLVAAQLAPGFADALPSARSKFLPGMLDEDDNSLFGSLLDNLRKRAQDNKLGGHQQMMTRSFSKSGGKGFESSSTYTSSSSMSGDGVEHTQSQSVTDEKEVGADGKEKVYRHAEACKDGLCKKAVRNCENGDCKESRDKEATREVKAKAKVGLPGAATEAANPHDLKFSPGGLDAGLDERGFTAPGFSKLHDYLARLEPLAKLEREGLDDSLFGTIRNHVAQMGPLDDFPSSEGLDKLISGSLSKSGGFQSSSTYTSSSSMSGDGIHSTSQTVTDEQEIGPDGKEIKKSRHAQACKDGLCKQAKRDCENGDCKESRESQAIPAESPNVKPNLRGANLLRKLLGMMAPPA